MDPLKWWQKAVFYQIYPRSFADANGDGIGDFKGITSKLNYLRDLGIDAIWLSPHYPSPFLDCGYDISDYTAVAPEYGTLDDFRTFLNGAHDHGIRVVLDLVLNHTSDMHPWFVGSRSSRDNPMRDWYIWRDGKDGGPPNNWDSIFGGSAWELDEPSGQYYYHAFLKEQPDLNWRNPEVKQAMWDAIRFWLDLGVDGFRLDAVSTIFEHPGLPDHEASMTSEELARVGLTVTTDAERKQLFEEYQRLLGFQTHQPGVHELMQELRVLVDKYPGDRVLVGEDEDFAYHGSGGDELQMVFNFPLMRVGQLTPEHIRENQSLRLSELPEGAWPCNTLGNHDSPRVWSRYGDGEHNDALARLHLALMLTLKGTPFLYNGEEIGMADLELSDIEQFRDTAALRQYRMLVDQLGLPREEALKSVIRSTRDRCRSPMQWSNAPNAGFSPPNVTPWLPVNPNYSSGVNVADQKDDPGSLLAFYKRLLALRRETAALVAGDYLALDKENTHCMVFLRQDPASDQICLVALNFSSEARTASIQSSEFEGLEGRQLKVLFSSNGEKLSCAPGQISLEPFEVLITELA